MRHRVPSTFCACVKLIKHYSMKTHGRNGCTDPRILQAPFTPPPPITHWIGGWAGHRTGLEDVEGRTFFPLTKFELSLQARSEVTIPTELSRPHNDSSPQTLVEILTRGTHIENRWVI
jgi:hypothetical protein